MFDDQEATENLLLTKMCIEEEEITQALFHKVTILGSGVASMACVITLLTQVYKLCQNFYIFLKANHLN